MACPKCNCRVTHYYSDDWDMDNGDSGMERCANCGHIFYDEYTADDEDYFEDCTETQRDDA